MSRQEAFDLREYIQKRALEIEALQERALYRQVTGELMTKLFDYVADAQERLEQRVLSEIRPVHSSLGIWIGLAQQAAYDARDSVLAPVCPEDCSTEPLTVADCMREHEPCAVERIFLRQNAQQVQRFAADTAVYQGTLILESARVPTAFVVRQSRRYLAQLAHLYEVFGHNFIAWHTVCSAYLYKMFDVYLAQPQHLCGYEQERVQGIEVDFGEQEAFVRRGLLPVWNLAPVQASTSMYPVPCVDRVSYEHRIFAHRLRAQCSYLCADLQRDIEQIRLSDGDLLISCRDRQPLSWQLLEVRQVHGQSMGEEPLLGNRPAEGAAAWLQAHHQHAVHTEGEIRRMVRGYGYEHAVKLRSIQVGIEPTVQADTYSMDFFMDDTLQARTQREVLGLYFTAVDPQYYLNADLMSFLVTRVQAALPAYRCVGILE